MYTSRDKYNFEVHKRSIVYVNNDDYPEVIKKIFDNKTADNLGEFIEAIVREPDDIWKELIPKHYIEWAEFHKIRQDEKHEIMAKIGELEKRIYKPSMLHYEGRTLSEVESLKIELNVTTGQLDNIQKILGGGYYAEKLEPPSMLYRTTCNDNK